VQPTIPPAATDTGLDVVTGSFSYSGRAITERLLAAGREVRTLTGHPDRADPTTAVDVRPLQFDDQAGLTSALQGATTLFNSYWVRFARRTTSHELAVANSRRLFEAARRANVCRIVHISITNPTLDSSDPYFRGKALVERALEESGVPHTILRPAILFGRDGVLLNNIAWLLRHLPVFAVGGDGCYRVRPIHVDDLARLCVEAAGEHDIVVRDAVGPERPTFLELVGTIRSAVGSHARIARVPGVVIPMLSGLLGVVVRDVLLTGDEYTSMARGLADTTGPATGETSLSEWIAASADTLGRRYLNELVLHYDRRS
jgi:NADH dehydrogenase